MGMSAIGYDMSAILAGFYCFSPITEGEGHSSTFILTTIVIIKLLTVTSSIPISKES